MKYLLTTEQLQDLVYDLYTLKTRAEKIQDIQPEKVEELAKYLDYVLKSRSYSNCVSVEFRYFKDKEQIVNALNFMYKSVSNIWSFEKDFGMNEVLYI